MKKKKIPDFLFVDTLSYAYMLYVRVHILGGRIENKYLINKNPYASMESCGTKIFYFNLNIDKASEMITEWDQIPTCIRNVFVFYLLIRFFVFLTLLSW